MFSPREPFFLQWHITDRCDLACRHCYRGAVKPELSAAELTAVFENFRRLRKAMPQPRARVQLAGGEPLLSPHLFHVLDLAAGAGFQTRVLTNGTRVDAALARDLVAHRCRVVQLSVDGGEASHDALRGDGAFRRAMEAARLLGEAGVEVTFAMTLTRESRPALGAFFDAARGRARRAGVHRLVPCGRGAELADQLLAPEELEAAFAEVWRQRQRAGGLEVPLRDPLWKPFVKHLCLDPHVDGCSAGHGGICVDSNGDVYPCRRMPVVIGNALRDELTDLWRSAPMARLRDRDQLQGKCGRCALRWRCGGCRAVAWAVSGDPLAEDPQCFFRPNAGERLAYRMASWWSRRMDVKAEDGGG
jgi:radical SAM protein with 4Fe4S-binding SPASM domain